MTSHSSFWLFICKLAGILFIFTSQSEGASECQMFQGCMCETVLNDKGVAIKINIVDCSFKGLRTVSVLNPNASYNIPIVEMKLNNNNISSLGDNILSNLNIAKLDLSDNPISSVNDDAFKILKNNLKTLILGGNSVSKPPKNAFGALSELEELTLRNYNVTDLHETDYYFTTFTKLQNLTLDNWQMESVGEDSFHLSAGNFLVSLTLLNQRLVSLPVGSLNTNDLSRLQKLQISGTLINKIGDYAFKNLQQIQEINLSGNQIHTLEIHCFNGIESKLVNLFLSNNSLTDETNLLGLTNLTNLQILDLSSNAMESNTYLQNLRTTKPLSLFLRNMKIKSLNENSFPGVADKLRILDVSDNDLTTILPNTFTALIRLEVLYLSYNKGTPKNALLLPSSLTQIAETLKQLHVDGQIISPSNFWPILQLPVLEVLNLSSTSLTSIPNKALFNLINLKSLDLSNNNLGEITQNALAGPRTLKFLSLSGTAIKHLSSCVFYQYTGYPISLAMGRNELICDCSIKWLWDLIKNNSVTFLPRQEALCSDKKTLDSKKIEDFCNSTFTEPKCEELYPVSQLYINLVSSDTNSVLVSWKLSDPRGLKYFVVRVSNNDDRKPVLEQNITASATSFTVNNLKNNTVHTVCVTAFFYGLSPLSNCSRTTTSKHEDHAGNDKEEIGIIIGAVVGAVVLLGILATIGYLIIFHRKHKEKSPGSVPVQPRNFSKSELPSMNEETRTFSKPKRPMESRAPEHREGMQVVAISDGHTGNMRVGRAQLMNSDGSFKISSKPSSTSSYENDHGPLPSVPSGLPSAHLGPGYYNMGFRDDKYDEISHGNGKESML